MRAMALGFAGFGMAFGIANTALSEPLDEKDLVGAFELSKACSNECQNESVNMVRLVLPKGKAGFLITTNDQGFCGSAGCSSAVVVVSGGKFVKIKEGLGITKAQAVMLASSEGSPRPAESLECSKQADAQGLHGAERLAFRSQCKANAAAESPPSSTSPTADSKTIYPTAVSSAYSQETEGRARMLTCRDQYNANKNLNANGGLQWVGAGGGYYSACNERLKVTGPALSPSTETGPINPPVADIQRARVAQPVTTQECAQKYQAAKAAGTLGGRQWNDFRRSECNSDAAPTPAVTAVVQNPNKPSFDCATAKSASARLICSDADLSMADGALGKAFQNAVRSLDVDAKKAKIQEQIDWIRERNRRCQLDGKIAAPLEDLRASKPCMVSWINIRIGELVGPAQAVAPSQATSNQSNLSPAVFMPVFGTSVTVCPGCPSGPQKDRTFYQVEYKTEVVTASAHCTLTNGSNRIGLGLGIRFNTFTRQLLDDEFVTRFLNNLRAGAYNACLKGFRDGILVDYLFRPAKEVSEFATARVFHNDGLGIEGYSEGLQSPWIFTYQGFKLFEQQRLAQIAAQEAAQAQAKRIAEAKQAVRSKVAFDLGYQQFIMLKDLAANPFRYKGATVAVQTRFARMMSESDAIFTINGVEMIVTGVPSTLFRGDEEVILGVRVIGTKPVKTPGGEITLPSGDYTGVYKCTQQNCGEYFDN